MGTPDPYQRTLCGTQKETMPFSDVPVRGGKICHAYLRSVPPVETSMDTNTEPDTQSDPCPQLRPPGSSPQCLPLRCDFSLGPNPRLGLQASVPTAWHPGPMSKGSVSHTRGLRPPPRRKTHPSSSGLQPEQEKSSMNPEATSSGLSPTGHTPGP